MKFHREQRGATEESRGMGKIREIGREKRKGVTLLQKIEAVEEKRKGGQEKREGPQARRSGKGNRSVGVGQRSGGRAGTRSFSPRSQTKGWEGQGQERTDRKLKI